MISGVHRIPIQNAIEPIGIGYIVIPHAVDRDNYIADAMRREKVNIMPDEGSGYISECNITKSALNQIEFPPNDNELGSPVCYVTHPFHNVPVIIGVLNKLDNSSLMEEKSFLFQKQVDNMRDVTVMGSGKDAYLLLSASNEEGDASIVIKSVGNEESRIQLETNGTVTLLGDETITLTSGQTINIRVNDEGDTNDSTSIAFNNDQIVISKKNGDIENTITIEDDQIQINPNSRFIVKQGGEPLVKGTELQNQLNATNTYINTLVTAIMTALTTIDGSENTVTAAPFSTTMLTVQLGNYSNINSDISFTD